MKFSFVIILSMIFAGCASTRILPIGPDTYMLHRSGGSTTGSSDGARMDGLEDAGNYCISKGKTLKVVSMQSGLSSFEYGADIQFRCLVEGDAELSSRPTLESVPQNVIKVSK